MTGGLSGLPAMTAHIRVVQPWPPEADGRNQGRPGFSTTDLPVMLLRLGQGQPLP